MRPEEVEVKVEELVEPLVNEEGLKLVSIDVQRRGRKLILSVYLDRDGGIDLDVCSRMSEEIGRYLDVEDIIQERYDLEVCSPGLDRVLKKPREYAAFKGRRIELWLKQPFEGRRKFEGELASASPGGISMLVEGEELAFDFEAIAKGKLMFDWKTDLKAEKTTGDEPR
jgi:ribosome maturation factor RimP